MPQFTAISAGPCGRRWPLGPYMASGLLLCCMGALLAGCGKPAYDGTVLREVAARGQDQNWEESRLLLKAHLLKYPEDPVGHYYYGLSYLHLQDPHLIIAEGELLTAQALLDREGSLPAGATDMNLDAFKGEVHQKTALVYMRAFRESMRMNVPYAYSRDLLLKASAQVDQGLKNAPDSHGLKEYAEFLKETLNGTPGNTPEIMTQAPGSGGSI